MAETMPAVAVERFGLEDVSLPAVTGVAELTEARIAARLVLRSPVDVALRVLGTGGFAAPEGINRAAWGPAGTSLQLGPDEWWILAATGDGQALAGGMAGGAEGASHSFVDVGHRTIGLVLEGARVEDVLASGCPLPLDLQAFSIGRATRTLFAKAEIVLWRVAAHRFHIEVARSFAPYLVAVIARAITSEAAFVARGHA